MKTEIINRNQYLSEVTILKNHKAVSYIFFFTGNGKNEGLRN